jgi:hypothetical protein
MANIERGRTSMAWLRLTLRNGQPTLVNMDNVIRIEPDVDGWAKLLSNPIVEPGFQPDSTTRVQETQDDILKRLTAIQEHIG